RWTTGRSACRAATPHRVGRAVRVALSRSGSLVSRPARGPASSRNLWTLRSQVLAVRLASVGLVDQAGHVHPALGRAIMDEAQLRRRMDSHATPELRSEKPR